jgi:hypothetical protein
MADGDKVAMGEFGTDKVDNLIFSTMKNGFVYFLVAVLSTDYSIALIGCLGALHRKDMSHGNVADINVHWGMCIWNGRILPRRNDSPKLGIGFVQVSQ